MKIEIPDDRVSDILYDLERSIEILDKEELHYTLCFLAREIIAKRKYDADK
jgi:hypothetical protein